MSSLGYRIRGITVRVVKRCRSGRLFGLGREGQLVFEAFLTLSDLAENGLCVCVSVSVCVRVCVLYDTNLPGR